MTQDEMHKALDAIKAALHEGFPEDHDRLVAISSHIATVGMYVDAIHDEAAKRAAEGK